MGHSQRSHEFAEDNLDTQQIIHSYVGRRIDADTVEVLTPDRFPLDPRLDLRKHSPPGRLPLDPRLRKHSPTGFEWGYGGSGPAQLALAILANHLEDDERALRLYQRFKDLTTARWQSDTWELTLERIDAIVAELES